MNPHPLDFLQRQKALTRVASWLALEAGLCLAAYAFIPSESQGGGVFGLSLARLALLTAMGLLFLTTAGLAWGFNRRPAWAESMAGRLTAGLHKGALWWLAIIACAGAAGVATFLLFELIISSDRYLSGILLRLAPLLVSFGLAGLHGLWLVHQLSPTDSRPAQPALAIRVAAYIWLAGFLTWFLATTPFLNEVRLFRVFVLLVATLFASLVYHLLGKLIPRKGAPTFFFLLSFLAVVLCVVLGENLETIPQWLGLLALMSSISLATLLAAIWVLRGKNPPDLEVRWAKRELRLNRTALLALLAGWAALLVLLGSVSVVVPTHEEEGWELVSHEIELDSEENVPTYTAMGLLFLCGATLWVTGLSARKGGWRAAIPWLFLGVFFIALGLDEGLGFHEHLSGGIESVYHGRGALGYSWVLAGMALVIAVGLLYARFFFRLPRRTQWLFLAAAAAFLGGALGVEMMGAWQLAHTKQYDANYLMLTVLEETMELAGTLIFLYACLDYLRRHAGLPVRLAGLTIDKVEPGAPEPASQPAN